MILSILNLLTGLYSKQIQKLNSGQGLVEYALILVLVAVVVIIVLSILGNVIANTMYGNIVGAL
jgi:pilus assembly protein Flp/PilA